MNYKTLLLIILLILFLDINCIPFPSFSSNTSNTYSKSSGYCEDCEKKSKHDPFYEKNWEVYRKKNDNDSTEDSVSNIDSDCSIDGSRYFVTFSEEPKGNKTNSNFKLLDDASLVKKFCIKDPENYHCEKLSRFIASANSNASIKHFPHIYENWDKTVGDDKYWNLTYHIIKLCEDNKIGLQETTNEIALLLKTFIAWKARSK